MSNFGTMPDRMEDDARTAREAIGGIVAETKLARRCIDRIRAICEDGERSEADRLDEIYLIVKGDG